MPKFETREEMIAWAKEQQRLRKLRDKEAFIKRWNNLGTFTKPEDVPPIPVTDTLEELREVYVPKLIAAGAIPKDQLIDGRYYLGNFRCGNYARWNAEKQMFEYRDFGWNTGIHTTYHFEDDNRFATYTPIKLLAEGEMDEKYKCD